MLKSPIASSLAIGCGITVGVFVLLWAAATLSPFEFLPTLIGVVVIAIVVSEVWHRKKLKG